MKTRMYWLFLRMIVILTVILIFGCENELPEPSEELSEETLPEVNHVIHGLNFSPYVEEGQNPEQGTVVSEEQIKELLEIIAPYTNWVRTFSSTQNMNNVGFIAHEMDLKVAAGAWLGSNTTANEDEISSLIDIAESGEADLLVVGSEVLERGDLTEAQLIAYINQVKQAVSETPVTTAEVYSKFLAHPALIEAVDVVFPTYYPAWEGIGVQKAVAWLHEKHQQIVEAAGGKSVIIAETGWPTSGKKRGEATPSLKNASLYFLNFASWAQANNVDYFYFEAFDEPWKTEDTWGPHWGIWYKDGEMKPGMQDVFNGETISDNWTEPSEPSDEVTITTTTWTKANSPYHITDTITVSFNERLVIEAGVDVLFDKEVPLIVKGELQAVGIETDSIRFLKGTVPSWRGLRISGGNTSTLAYTRISNAKVSDTVFWSDWGGALYISGSETQVSMSNSVISKNSNPDGYGGGVANKDSTTLTMVNCIISDNSAINGGGILNSNAEMIIKNSAIFNNEAEYYGGGIANYSHGVLTMTRCAIFNNTTSLASGGGVLNDFNATLIMRNITVSNNEARNGGGGFVYNANGATLEIINSILWGNKATSDPEIRRQSGKITIRYSDVEGGIPDNVTDNGGNIDADPLFVNEENNNYHLQAESPCIDAGDPDFSPDPDGSRRDMGAFPYEKQITGVSLYEK